jgi:hypothetical protein
MHETANVSDFGWALDQLRAGKRVSRNNWNGPGQYLELQVPDGHSKMTLPYIYIKTVQGDLVPWLASQTDMLASDWCMTIPDAEGSAPMTASGLDDAEGGGPEPPTE